MGKIFISYRREDSADSTGRICDRLKDHFGAASIMRDVDSLPSGSEFRKYLANAVHQCNVLLVIIGKNWQEIKDSSGVRRLHNAHDLVRIEIESALEKNIPIIPVIVQGAAFPSPERLPESIRGLVNRNGVVVRPDPDFHADADRLIRDLDKVLERVSTKPSDDLTRFECCHCGKRLKIAASFIGKSFKCPDCQMKQIVPMPNDSQEQRSSRRPHDIPVVEVASGSPTVTRNAVKVPILVSAIGNIVLALVWISTCFLGFLAIPCVLLCIFEFMLYAKADTMPVQKLCDQAKVIGILEIVNGLWNTISLICGIIVLINAGKLRVR